jgi:hypothetical protein
MIQATYIDVLKRICRLLSDLDHPWAITGSMGMALQGVDIDVHDIDIQTDSAGAYLIQDRLSDHVVSNLAPFGRKVLHRVSRPSGASQSYACSLAGQADCSAVTLEGGLPPSNNPRRFGIS